MMTIRFFVIYKSKIKKMIIYIYKKNILKKMFRKSNGGIISNNTIVYNRLVNKKTKNITNVPENSKDRRMFNDEDDKMKINCNNLYKYSVSNSTKKVLNRRDKYYRITEDDFEVDDYYTDRKEK